MICWYRNPSELVRAFIFFFSCSLFYEGDGLDPSKKPKTYKRIEELLLH